MLLRYIYVSCLSMLFLTSCTVYTEKQSEALSRSVYATKDSIDYARIDLADYYISESIRLVRPPKERVSIQSVYKKDEVSTEKKVDTVVNKQRVLLIPEKYKSDKVITVNSQEYEQLLKDKETSMQLEKDFTSITKTKQLVDAELVRQMEYNDKMIKDLNIMQKKLVEKDLAILQRNIIIVALLTSIGVGIYLRMKGIL
jgi:hypothetical protein